MGGKGALLPSGSVTGRAGNVTLMPLSVPAVSVVCGADSRSSLWDLSRPTSSLGSLTLCSKGSMGLSPSQGHCRYQLGVGENALCSGQGPFGSQGWVSLQTVSGSRADRLRLALTPPAPSLGRAAPKGLCSRAASVTAGMPWFRPAAGIRPSSESPNPS